MNDTQTAIPQSQDSVLYRKWRPTRFDEVAGQEHVATTLKNALATGRVAHAYLLSGSRGTGKTSTGRLLGKALNCTDRQDGEPCNRCESCRSFLAGRAIDLIELDAASNRGIDEIRSLRDKVAFAPGAGAYKVYLIDEVHMLTDAAFNALLKTLEEPPPHAIFILATTEAHKLPATVASRCQRFDFKRIPLAAAMARLQTICEGEGIRCEPEALELIARQATGSLRDGTNLLDQLATSYGSDLTVERVRAGLGLIADERVAELARVALRRDLAAGLTLIASVRDDGLDLRQFQKELVDELRDLLMVKSGLPPTEGATEERLEELREAVAGVPTAQILTALKAFGEADLKLDPNSTLPLDIALADCVLATGEAAAPVGMVESPAPATATPQRQAPARAEPQAARSAQASGSSRAIESRLGAANRPQPRPADEIPPPPEYLHDVPPIDDAPAARPANGSDAQPTAVAQPPSETASPSLEAARAAMRTIYERAKAVGFQLGALLNGGCDIIQADDDLVVLGFKAEFHAAKMSEKANKEAITRIISEVLGRPVTVRCDVSGEVVAWTQREANARARENPLVRAAQEMGAQVVRSGPDQPTGPEDYK